MYPTYEHSTDRNDQLVMMIWLGGAGVGFAAGFVVGMSYLGLM